MDLATLIGLLAAIAIVIGAILIESNILDFVNLPGLAIVIVGTVFVTLIKYRLVSVTASFKLAFTTVFVEKSDNPIFLIQQVRELSAVVRKEGILGLENVEIEDPFLSKGISLCIDGHPPEFGMREVLRWPPEFPLPLPPRLH